MKKLSKKLLLASLGFAAATITVPVVLTSCADRNKGGGNDQQQINLNVASSFSYVGSINDLFNGSETPTTVANMLVEKIKSNEDYKKQVVMNYNNLSPEQQKSLDFKITSSNNQAWEGTQDLTGDKDVYYDINSKQLTISSLKDLQDKLTPEFLTNAFKEAGVTTENAEYKLAENAKLNFNKDNNYIGVVVDETVADALATRATTKYNLMIPTSDLNVELKDAKISVTSTLDQVIDVTDQNIDLTFDVGVESKPMFDNTKEIDMKLEQATTMNVLKKLVWVKGENTENPGTYDLDSGKIGDDIKIFNTTFTADENSLSTKKENGKYDLTLKATPNSGYSWSDGTNTEKTIVISDLNVINETQPGVSADATIPALDETTKVNADISSETINVTSDDLDAYFKESDNLKSVTDKLTADKGFANVTFAFVSQESKDGKYVLTLTATPSANHVWKEDGTSTAKEVKVLVSLTFNTAKVNANATYSTEIDLSKENYVESEVNIQTYLTEEKAKPIVDSVKAELEKDQNTYAHIESLTFDKDSVKKVDTKYQLTATATSESGYVFADGKNTTTVTIELSTIKWSQLGATATNKNLTAADLNIGTALQNLKPTVDNFKTWFDVEANQNNVKELISKNNIQNASISKIEVTEVTKDKTTLTSTVKANAGYVFEDKVSEKTITTEISGIQWSKNELASTVNYDEIVRVQYLPTESANYQLDAKLKNVNDPDYQKIVAKIKTDIKNIKDTITYVGNSANATFGDINATAKFNVEAADGYSFEDYSRSKEITVNIKQAEVKIVDSSINTTHPYSQTIDLSTKVESEQDVKDYFDNNTGGIKENIVDELKTSANPQNIKVDGYTFNNVTKEGNNYVANFVVAAADGHLFKKADGTYSLTENVKVTLNIKWLDLNAKVNTTFNYDDLVQLNGTADTDVTKDQFSTWLQTEANKTKLISDIQAAMLDATKGEGKFSELTIKFESGPEEVAGTTNFTIVVEATANKGFAFGAADKTTETITVTLKNVKNPVTTPTP